MAAIPVPTPEPEVPQQQPKAAAAPSAVAQYDYEAAEGNEISFPDGAIIEDIVRFLLFYLKAFRDQIGR